MSDWTVIAASVLGLFLSVGWITSDERRRQWKRAFRRRRCRHPEPCLEGRYRGREPGWARAVYYCPDCKHLWARPVPVSEEEWACLPQAAPARVSRPPQAGHPAARFADTRAPLDTHLAEAGDAADRRRRTSRR